MKVFVTGATGFTGSHTVPLLIEKGVEVKCLIRPGRDHSELDSSDIEWALGDLNDLPSLKVTMQDCDVLVNIASLGFGHARNIISAAQSAGIQRAIFISTTAIFTKLNAKSKQVRLSAEESIQNSGLAYTILRPTMIYGSRRDRNIWRLIQFIKKFPIIPVIGDGTNLQQPVFVEDVAQSIVKVLDKDQTIGKCYNIAGQNALSYNEMIDTIASQLHKRSRKIHIPEGITVRSLSLLEKMHIPFFIKSEQVLRLNEDKKFNFEEALTDFQYNPRMFSEGIEKELDYRKSTK
ncbi:MAG: SDR family oxidoreductase [Anaerolineaceae bacterium]